MKKYPEHEKLESVKEQSQFLGEFLDWCGQQGMSLAEYRYGDNYMLPVNKSISTLLSEFLKINLIKLENEKRSMLDSLRKQSNKSK